MIDAQGGSDTIAIKDEGVSVNRELRDRNGNVMQFEITGSGSLTLANQSVLGNQDLELRGSIRNAGNIDFSTPQILGAFAPFNSLAGAIHLGPGTIVSSRSITGTDVSGGTSTADSGNITFNSRSITIDAGSQLLRTWNRPAATPQGTSRFTAEDKTLTADFSVIGVTKNTASIVIDGTTIAGGDIAIQTDARDLTLSDAVPSWVNDLLIGAATDALLSKLSIPAAAMVRGSESTIDVTDSSITGSGNVTIDANAIVDASGKAISVNTSRDSEVKKFLNSFAAAYSQATATATVNVTGTAAKPVSITAAGDVNIKSNVENTASATAATYSNVDQSAPVDAKAIGGSFAVSRSNTTAHTILTQFTEVVSGANVNVHATGKTKTGASASTTVYRDGLAGVGLGLGFDNVDIKAEVDGVITAAGIATDKPFTLTNVSAASDTITIAGHGFTDGEKVTYTSTSGTSIGGLSSGRDYYVRVIDANTIALQSGLAIDLENAEVDPTATHSLRRRTATQFDAADPANISLVNDTLRIQAHGLSAGDEIYYSPLTEEDTVIEGLGSLRDFYAIPFDANNIRLAVTRDEALADEFIDLTSLGSGQQILAYEQVAKSFSPTADVSPSDDMIVMPGHGFADGDAVVYRTDPTRSQEVASKRTSTFSSASTANEGAIDLAANTITSINHSFNTGQQIVYRKGTSSSIGTTAGLLIEGQTYFAIRVNADHFKIASSRNNAATGTAIDLTTAGTGDTHAFETSVVVMTFEGGRNQNVVDVAANTIEINGHGLGLNDRVTYLTGGGEAIGGLADDTDYFVIPVDPDHIQLSTSEAGAVINLTSLGSLESGLQGLSVSQTFSFDAAAASVVDVASDTLSIRPWSRDR
ncbi:MAG: hypothetical protein R3C05_19195 [Pirellulaceae bacterium]